MYLRRMHKQRGHAKPKTHAFHIPGITSSSRERQLLQLQYTHLCAHLFLYNCHIFAKFLP